ncbi:dihydropteroate synthase [Opitutus sp. GAS368]|uniref:dihydropteroate synthase n=1 Tax=Opitutus sp. GAS368 TaxID=1882749 RepID=UPI0008793CC7|nr:dihydropteroate synthase [Opitutus sp. GAS368]SDR76905.1 Dihydropteroate synthase [Opitutus sp. GAS368]
MLNSSTHTSEFWQSPHGRSLPAPGGRTLVMGILNVTPDSFSDGNQLPTPEAVVERAGRMIAEGADVLDIGGESTRPGAAAVSAAMELDRVLPAIESVRQQWPDIPLSIDTYKAEVATAAVRAGADIVNDVWGLTHSLSEAERAAGGDSRGKFGPPAPTPMARAVAALGCPVIVMHNRFKPDYRDFWPDLLRDLQLSLTLAAAAGIPRHQIWLDPGFGFAKDVAQNLAVVRDLGRIVALGHPVLLGTSRKSTIGRVLDAPVDDRLDGTGATLVWGIQQGCQMVRVHDVAAMRRYVRMADALKQGLNFLP